MSTADKALRGVGGYLDDRFRGAKSLRTFFRKIFPDHWSFLLGEIALYSFIILLLTGTFLTLFFNPSMTDVVYHGTYTKLNGVRMSEAYASTLNISFDVRGGLLMRQIHHWAALLFLAAIMSHMLRIFFTGAFRKPREINWLIGVTLLTLGILEGFVGYSLPDDLLSGTGLRILEGVLLSIPIVGTYVTFFVLGGQFPGHLLIPRLYIVHVLLLPALILALVTAHLFIMFHQKHTQMPGKARTDHNVVGGPMYPYFMAKTGAFFFFIFAVLAGLSTVAQINPIWLFGPYNPAAISAGSQPDFYMGWLEGALRMMPAWQINLWGYALSLSVFIAALLIFGLLMTGLALYPFIEQWVTGDKREHHVLDRPRNAATRTAIGRQRPDRALLRHPAVLDDLVRPDRHRHRPHRRLHPDQADLPWPAAQGPRADRARRGERHHQAASERRVHRGHAPAGRRVPRRGHEQGPVAWACCRRRARRRPAARRDSRARRRGRRARRRDSRARRLRESRARR